MIIEHIEILETYENEDAGGLHCKYSTELEQLWMDDQLKLNGIIQDHYKGTEC